jgi:hypothetical protein
MPLPQIGAYPPRWGPTTLKSGVPVRLENSNSNSEMSLVSFDSSGNPLHDYKKRSYHNPILTSPRHTFFAGHPSQFGPCQTKCHFLTIFWHQKHDNEKNVFLESTQSEVRSFLTCLSNMINKILGKNKMIYLKIYFTIGA